MSFEVQRKPRFHRRCYQLRYFAPTSSEPPTWNIKFLASMIYKHCFWNGTFSDNFIYQTYPYEDQDFVSRENFNSFMPCEIANIESFPQTWNLMEAPFSLWFLRCGLSGAHNLKTSPLKRNNSCFRHMQTFFTESNNVQKIDSRFFIPLTS